MKLSDGEWKIMQILWREPPRTIIQITKTLAEDTGWTKHTVISYLKRMEEKGAVKFETEGRTKKYYPVIQEGEAEVRETRDFLEKVFHGRFGLMLHTMVQQQSFTDEEIEEMQQILEQAKKMP